MSTSFVELHVISDSTGETAVRLVLALEAQFPDTEFEVVRHPRVETPDDVQLAVSRTKDRPAVIVYTLVDQTLRETMRELCSRDGLHCCDLLGQPIEEVAAVAGKAAKMESGRRPPLDSQYFKRMEAIEFAVKYDDGLGVALGEADIVLVGVSRTSKTPLSMYLGYLGYKVANVPIVREVEPPKALFEIDRTKIVGLTIDAERLSEIRQVRARLMRLSTSAYSELVEIYEELEHASVIHRQLGCPVVDVSELSIEETAQRVLRLVERRKAAAAAPRT